MKPTDIVINSLKQSVSNEGLPPQVATLLGAWYREVVLGNEVMANREDAFQRLGYILDAIDIEIQPADEEEG